MKGQNPMRPQNFEGHAQEKRGINSAGKGYPHPIKAGEVTTELFEFACWQGWLFFRVKGKINRGEIIHWFAEMEFTRLNPFFEGFGNLACSW